MAYSLSALIGVGAAPPGAFVLPQNAWLLPLTGDGPHPAQALSLFQPVAYVTAEFFGGQGAQTAEVFRDGKRVATFEPSYDAINNALAELGIIAEPPNDAFDTLGLGRHRRTEYWLR